MYEECTTWSPLHVKDFFQRGASAFSSLSGHLRGNAWSGDQAPAEEVPAPLLPGDSGEEMKKTASGFLAVLHAADPKSVGGALPDEGLYYLG